MANKIQLRRGVKANLPILSVGEPAFCTDTKELYMGTSSGNVRMSYDTGQGVVAIDSDKLGGQLPSYYLNYTNFTNKPSIPNIAVSSTDLTYYVSPTGNDSNNGTSSSSPFKTIAKAISVIPQIVNHAVTINVANGTYNEDVVIKGFLGSGTLRLIGDSEDNCIIKSCTMTGCHLGILVSTNDYISCNVENFTANTTSQSALTLHSCINASYTNCKVVASATDKLGFDIIESTGVLKGCLVNNRSTGISVYRSRLHLDNTTSSGNQAGITMLAGIIFANQLTCTGNNIYNTYAGQGGQIFD